MFPAQTLLALPSPPPICKTDGGFHLALYLQEGRAFQLSFPTHFRVLPSSLGQVASISALFVPPQLDPAWASLGWGSRSKKLTKII